MIWCGGVDAFLNPAKVRFSFASERRLLGVAVHCFKQIRIALSMKRTSFLLAIAIFSCSRPQVTADQGLAIGQWYEEMRTLERVRIEAISPEGAMRWLFNYGVDSSKLENASLFGQLRALGDSVIILYSTSESFAIEYPQAFQDHHRMITDRTLDSNSGESTNVIPGVSNDTIFTTLVTVAIFSLGILFQRTYDGYKEWKQHKSVRLFVHTCLAAILPAIDKQVEAFAATANQMDSGKHLDFVYSEDASLSFGTLGSLPRADVFRAFMSQKNEDFQKRIVEIYESIDFIVQQRGHARDSFVRFNEAYHRYLTLWNDAMDAIQKLHDEYHAHAQRQQRADQFFARLSKLVRNLNLEPIEEFGHTKEIFLDPLLVLCNDHTTDERALAISGKIVQANTAFDNRKNLLRSYSQYFIKQSSDLSGRKDIIRNADEFLISNSHK